MRVALHQLVIFLDTMQLQSKDLIFLLHARIFFQLKNCRVSIHMYRSVECRLLHFSHISSPPNVNETSLPPRPHFSLRLFLRISKTSSMRDPAPKLSFGRLTQRWTSRSAQRSGTVRSRRRALCSVTVLSCRALFWRWLLEKMGAFFDTSDRRCRVWRLQMAAVRL